MNDSHQPIAKKSLSRKVSTALYLVALVGVAWMVLAPAGSAAGGSATRVPQVGTPGGDVLFVRRCGGCHYLDDDKEGPRLRHVYGTKAGKRAAQSKVVRMMISGVGQKTGEMDPQKARIGA